ncbi:MAG: hypothetical protein KKG59_02895 [Nanoarchaeota archaeon]|nr:hypothetical protein [Nanoarchaeota archaeon]
MVEKKGQAAMEYLSTYGWALMIIIVALAALAYFGVLNPDMFLPEKCNFESGILCDDFMSDIGPPGKVSLMLVNGLGKAIKIDDVSFAVYGAASVTPVECITPDWCDLAKGIVSGATESYWKADETRELVLELTGLTPGDRPKIAIEMEYAMSGEFFNKNITGEIFVKVN